MEPAHFMVNKLPLGMVGIRPAFRGWGNAGSEPYGSSVPAGRVVWFIQSNDSVSSGERKQGKRLNPCGVIAVRRIMGQVDASSGKFFKITLPLAAGPHHIFRMVMQMINDGMVGRRGVISSLRKPTEIQPCLYCLCINSPLILARGSWNLVRPLPGPPAGCVGSNLFLFSRPIVNQVYEGGHNVKVPRGVVKKQYTITVFRHRHPHDLSLIWMGCDSVF